MKSKVHKFQNKIENIKQIIVQQQKFDKLLEHISKTKNIIHTTMNSVYNQNMVKFIDKEIHILEKLTKLM